MTKTTREPLNLFLRGRKGLSVLSAVKNGEFTSLIGQVVVDGEVNVAIDYSEQIFDLARELKLNAVPYERGLRTSGDFALAAGWQYLIQAKDLLVIHDSLLPRYRGFNPLVSMLVNKEPEIGATLIWANDKPDMGPIIKAESCAVEYPLKLDQALNRITEIYERLTNFILTKVSIQEEIVSFPQDEEKASYSLWRDEADYQIDWSSSAAQIQSFIFAVGEPYLGASSILQARKIRILDCEVVKDLRIENRQHGKVYALDEGRPIVVCGEGLLKVTGMVDDMTRQSVLPLKSMKIRFEN